MKENVHGFCSSKLSCLNILQGNAFFFKEKGICTSRAQVHRLPPSPCVSKSPRLCKNWASFFAKEFATALLGPAEMPVPLSGPSRSPPSTEKSLLPTWHLSTEGSPRQHAVPQQLGTSVCPSDQSLRPGASRCPHALWCPAQGLAPGGAGIWITRVTVHLHPTPPNAPAPAWSLEVLATRECARSEEVRDTGTSE